MLLIEKPQLAKIDAVRPVIEMDYAEQAMSNQPHDNVKAFIWLPLIVPRVPFMLLESCRKVMMGAM